MTRLWAVLREISWTAVLSVVAIAGVVALAVLGGSLETVVAFGLAGVALAVLNLKA
jgi:hypothetical protein